MEVEDAKEIHEGAPAPEFGEQTEIPELVAEPPRKPRPRLSAIAMVGTFALGIIAFVYFAKVFFLPLTLALLLSFLHFYSAFCSSLWSRVWNAGEFRKLLGRR